jgi:MFS superfamily sulfate permease-like transporter
MSKQNLSPRANLAYDLPAAVVVFLVALPLCLGIALASGVPPFSGLIAGMVGGIVIGFLSKSPLSVSGPAAGLAVIVLAAVQELPSFEAFLLAVALSGVLQVGLGLIRAGVIGDFIPSSVIKGMLAAIGLTLILKQIPHALGYDKDYEGDEAFVQPDGETTFSEIWVALQSQFTWGAVIISVISLIFLFWWDSKKIRKPGFLEKVPGPLVVVLFGILANIIFQNFFPNLVIQAEHLVGVPISDSVSGFFSQFKTPDFSYITDQSVWTTAGTLALIASIETLLSIEAVDKLDPFKRSTPNNRELIAQGVGNFTSGMIGGMPVTSVIVRSSANVSSGARTQVSAIVHGLLLLLSIIVIPRLLNLIPLSALAAVLISVGYKLTKPQLFMAQYKQGWAHLIPFVVTIVAILLTDLLIGVGVGIFVGGFFILYGNFRSALTFTQDNGNCLIQFKKDLSFIHKYELRRILAQIPEGCNVLLDLSNVEFVDLDNAEIINDFIESTKYRDITVTIKPFSEQTAKLIKTPEYEPA